MSLTCICGAQPGATNSVALDHIENYPVWPLSIPTDDFDIKSPKVMIGLAMPRGTYTCGNRRGPCLK